jgi:DNA primase
MQGVENMGKISPVSAKYIIHIEIAADGVVDKPDVIGAVFGQTEGLLGTELELRELQKNGRIGRIEVNLDTKSGKTGGMIVIPSSLDMAETAIVASSLETIQRIGPCNAKLQVKLIEDVRVSKREYVVGRAKELLRGMIDKGPESGELMEEIKESVRALEIVEFGPEKLPAGPGINEGDEIIVVEGRADVITLLRNGFRNVIGLNGTSIPESVALLTKQKITTAFVDGDRGGVLIVKGLAAIGDVDFVARAPVGKEVEEITKKEINKCLRARIPLEQFMEENKELGGPSNGAPRMQPQQPEQRPQERHTEMQQRPQERYDRFARQRLPPPRPEPRIERRPTLPPEIAEQFKKMLEELVGTRGAYLLDESMNILGKVPVKELGPTLSNLTGVSTVIMDGVITTEVVAVAESSRVRQLVAMEAKAAARFVKIFTAVDLGLV